jgi:hypothetical protein
MNQSALSRRKLLAAAGLGGAGLVATSWTSSLAAATGSSPLGNVVKNVQASTQQAGLSQLSALVGQSFNILNGTSSVAVTLVSVTPMQAAGTRPSGMRPYALAAAFEGQNGPTFPAGNQTYTFQLDGGSQMQLFVGRKSVTGTTARLIAILN